MENGSETMRNIRVLCRKLLITNDEPGLQWLIGSPFFPEFTIVSTIRCLHGDSTEPDYSKEADDLRTLILRGFEVIGALVVSDHNFEDNAKKAAEAARRIRRLLPVYCDGADDSVIGAAAELSTGETRFFVSKTGNSSTFQPSTDVYYEDCPEKFVWETGCLLRCEVGIKLPVFVPVNRPADAENIFSSAIDGTAAMLRDPKIVFMVDGENEASEGVSNTVILRGADLHLDTGLPGVKFQRNVDAKSCPKSLLCSAFCAYNKSFSSQAVWESAGIIKLTVLINQSVNSSSFSAPVAEYFPVSEEAKCFVVSFKLEVLCYAAKGLPLASAISMLVVPALSDQLLTMKKAFLPCLLSKHPQLHPYHFCPPGILHPLTIIYELNYGEKEMKQVELRRKLHLRLGLPLDRPLLLIANALNFATKKGVAATNSIKNASPLLKDVHAEVPSSGVSGGLVSLVDGSYEYYHYLQNGFDDSGWGCAYRSLQTIVSWFKQQHYTSIEVPSHREIQQALVEIGDKDPSFVDSREWIGAIELSFVLDKLLGVSCKIINVRSGSELPEKCRELALHFENQGTPVMIGGGVLAYTLLGVDYNEATGDSAFLILDPHYTGSDDLKKVINGGWCGWKKPVDSKGRNFFLHDKFYNLLLPQRPNWV